MPDVVDKATRSRMMSGIRGRDTKPEMQLRKSLHALGFRYRLQSRKLPGRPDLVLPKYRAVVFVHGCFWHRHPGCRYTTTPSTNAAFWGPKFADTMVRDERNHALLRTAGWRVAVVWECALRQNGGDAIAAQVGSWLRSGEQELEIPRSAGADCS